MIDEMIIMYLAQYLICLFICRCICWRARAHALPNSIDFPICVRCKRPATVFLDNYARIRAKRKQDKSQQRTKTNIFRLIKEHKKDIYLFLFYSFWWNSLYFFVCFFLLLVLLKQSDAMNNWNRWVWWTCHLNKTNE